MEKLPNSEEADSNPMTTFVHADTRNFREVVQRLTGPFEAERIIEATILKGGIGVKKPAFKLHERRQYRAKLEIIKPTVGYKPGESNSQHFEAELQSPLQIFSPSRGWNLSPSSTPTKSLSNLSLRESEIRNKPASPDLSNAEEEKAITEKRFFLHPSPRSKPQFSEPELLSLFPLTSAKTSNKM